MSGNPVGITMNTHQLYIAQSEKGARATETVTKLQQSLDSLRRAQSVPTGLRTAAPKSTSSNVEGDYAERRLDSSIDLKTGSDTAARTD